MSGADHIAQSMGPIIGGESRGMQRVGPVSTKFTIGGMSNNNAGTRSSMVSKGGQPGSGLHIMEGDLTPVAHEIPKNKSHLSLMHRNQLDQSNEALDGRQAPSSGSGVLREGERGQLGQKDYRSATNESQAPDVNFYPQKAGIYGGNPSLSSSAVQDAQTYRAAGKKGSSGEGRK